MCSHHHHHHEQTRWVWSPVAHQHRGPAMQMDDAYIYSPKVHNGAFKAPGIKTFMGAPYCPPDRNAIREMGAKVCFLGIPYDEGNVAKPGASSGPEGLRASSTQYFPYSPEYDIDLLKFFRVVDCGDVPVIPSNPRLTHSNIYNYVMECIEGGAMLLLGGGDHSIPIPSIQALSQHFSDKTLGFCAFDCHLDASPDWGGIEFTNASNTSRAAELPNCDPVNMVHVGSRNGLNPKDWLDFCIDNGIRIIPMREIAEQGIEQATRVAMDICANATDMIYLTFDSDVLDASCAPGTTEPEPGGILAREAIRAARIFGEYDIQIFDVSEHCEVYDKNNITGKLLCNIFYEFLGARAKKILAEGGRCATEEFEQQEVKS